MSYGLVCDTLHAHRKPAKAGLEAMGLWALALSWSKEKRTNGFVPADRPGKLADDHETGERCAARLVAAGLWDVVEGGYAFHDWQEHQHSPEGDDARKEARRQAKVEAGRKGGLARVAKAKQEQPEPKQDQADTKQIQAGSSTVKQAQAEPSNLKPKSEPKSDPSGGSAAVAAAPPPKVKPRRGKPEQRSLLPADPKPPAWDAVFWGIWRESYRELRGGAEYTGNGNADGKFAKDIAAAALQHLQVEGRSTDDFEPLVRHWSRCYLQEPGSAKFRLADVGHGLQWYQSGIPRYGTPWDASVARAYAPGAKPRTDDMPGDRSAAIVAQIERMTAAEVR